MNKVCELHLKAIEENIILDGNNEEAMKAAYLSSKITEDIALAFKDWLVTESTIDLIADLILVGKLATEPTNKQLYDLFIKKLNNATNQHSKVIIQLY